jgi:hypothetical protein
MSLQHVSLKISTHLKIKIDLLVALLEAQSNRAQHQQGSQVLAPAPGHNHLRVVQTKETR